MNQFMGGTMMSMTKRMLWACLVLMLASSAFAQVHTDLGDLYIDFGISKFDIDGEFDDSIYLSTSSQFINVPEVLESTGYSLAVGRAWNQGGLSFFYFFGNPETASVLGDSQSRFHLYGMDFYGLPLAKKNESPKITPLLRGSLSLASLGIDDSATDGSRVTDATFRGGAAAIGIGVLVQLNKNAHITAEIDHRWMTFGTVKGTTGDSIDMGDNITLSTNFLRVGLSVYQ